MNLPLVAAGVVALAIGIIVAWPAWRSSRERSTQLAHEERYLAWRGRADRVAPPPPASAAERRRLLIGAGLAVIGAACVVIGLVVT